MQTAPLTAHEKTTREPILIVDKIGVIGEKLSQELSKDYIVFFLSNRRLSEFNKNIIQIPFKGKIPKVVKNNYAKIFLIDDGQSITKESAFSFIKKAKLINSEVYFLGSIRNVDLKYSDEIIKSYEKVKVLIFGDLFDNEILFDRNSSITRFISEARKNKKIKVRGDGLSLNYPVSFDDSIKLIIKAIHIKIPEKAILLFPQHPITDISLANTFKKIDPEIDVDFINSVRSQNIYIPNNKEYALTKYDLIRKLSEIDLKTKSGYAVEYKEKSQGTSFFKPILFFILACIFLLLLPLISTYTYSFLGMSQINSAKKAADEGDFSKALGKVNNAKTFFEFAKQTSGPLVFEAQLINQSERVEPIVKNINSGMSLSNASADLLNGIVSLQNVKTKGDLHESLNYFKNANILLQELKATNQFPKQMSKELQDTIPLVEMISNSSDVAPEILGFDNEKKYLVLFQDNLNLRPSGGEIKAVGSLKIKNGKITGFKIDDASSLDKSLNVFVAPPFALRRFLPTDNFYLKDTSSNSDFVNSAIDASNVYQIISGNDVDGVIGLNLGFIKKLISLDNNEVSYLNTKINDKNLYEYLANNPTASNINFYNQLIAGASSGLGKSIPYASLSEIVGSSILEKDLLFAFKDPNIQNIFTVNKFSNTLVESRKNENNTILDYFGISEMNLGKNNVNYFISRSVSREVRLTEENEFTSVAKISFKNSSEKLSYKTYLQIILPNGSKINELSVGGRIVQLRPAVVDPAVYEGVGFRALEGAEIEQVNQGDKTIFGFLINVPPQAIRAVSVSYSLPFRFNEQESFTKYSLLVYKQPGVEVIPFEQKFNLPENFKILPVDSLSVEIKKDETFNFIISEEK